jgi:HK97 gp10 family phage protein
VIKVNVIGLKELRIKMATAQESMSKQVRGIVEAGAMKFVRDAKRDAPVNFGVMRNFITYSQVISDKSRTTFEVHSQAKYSPYLEWGTITRVIVPAELSVYAALFKGKGLRKNGGIFPHPFFFKQTAGVKKFIETGIKAIKL